MPGEPERKGLLDLARRDARYIDRHLEGLGVDPETAEREVWRELRPPAVFDDSQVDPS